MVSINYVYIFELDGTDYVFGSTSNPRELIRKYQNNGKVVKVVGITTLTYTEARKCLGFLKHRMKQNDFVYWAKQKKSLVATWLTTASGVSKHLANNCWHHVKDLFPEE